MRRIFVVCILMLFAQLASSASAAELRIAVASNFASTARVLLDAYSSTSKDRITLLVGSTGKHTSQIQYGLNVHVFLAADTHRPKYLEDNGFALPGSRFTYAVGRLALWSKDATLVDANGEVLKAGGFNRLAIANPKTAPYGAAAKQVVAKLGISPNLVRGESVAQAFQFASSGGADLAFLALAQVKNLDFGSYWLVPQEWHQAIEQQAILIVENRSAEDFMGFLKSEAALKIIESYGYLRP